MNRNTLVNRTLIALALVGTLAACQSTTESSNIETFSQQLVSSDRPDTDKGRDEGRKPAQVMEFFGVKKGMTVLEVLSSGGYYTEILSQRVGDHGKVIAQNNRFILDVFDGRFSKEFDKRFDNNRLNNVDHYIEIYLDYLKIVLSKYNCISLLIQKSFHTMLARY